MNIYQLNYLTKNIIDKSFKILKKPKLFELYFNEYLKGILFNIKIDGYIISYPKCGRTWLYKMLSLYSNRLNADNHIKNRKMVKFDDTFIKFVHDCSDPSPYPIKHFKFKNKELNYKKKIILIRDPREVIVSHWNHLKFRENTYKENINNFIEDEYLGIQKIISFYNFLNLNSSRNSKLVSYKKLVDNTFEEVKSILLFFNLRIQENLINKCIEDCAFDKLQKDEMKESKNTDIKTMKFRKGPLGNFNNELSKDQIIKINNAIRGDLNNNYKKKLNLENL